MRIGIFFGGVSREREISFAGGRTVFDNLDKTIFQAVPIFVDSFYNLILLDWQYLYKGTIRDFYPPIDVLPSSPNYFQIYIESLGKLTEAEQTAILSKIGKKIHYHELNSLIDLAFLALHGSFGEDGQIQGILESLHIPYTGSGIRPSSIGMSKSFQKKIMAAEGFAHTKVAVESRKSWLQCADPQALYAELSKKIGFPLVIRPSNQGSSIGVSIVAEKMGFEGFVKAMNKAFFVQELTASYWNGLTKEEKISHLRQLSDIREGIGLPVFISKIEKTIYHPEDLLVFLNDFLSTHERVLLEGYYTEREAVIEEFIEGKEFSCVVIRNENGTAVALPPTEIVKGGEVFDYRSKYLAGLSRKITPIQVPDEQIRAIMLACEHLYNYLDFDVYARIDGFITSKNIIHLNDPNTTSGMLPSSFFFHQASEIGLTPSQFLTYIVRTSLVERIGDSMELNVYEPLLKKLDEAIQNAQEQTTQKIKVGVIMGGYSSERHISVESGRNVFEKLASSAKYTPIPIFLMGNDSEYSLYRIPINLLLKDNADDIKDKILHFAHHPIVQEIKAKCTAITTQFAANAIFEPIKWSLEELKTNVDKVFIALHGRPGEDGKLQADLEKYQIPYNGSGVQSSQLTINKYQTLQTLAKHGFTVTRQHLLPKNEWLENSEKTILEVENKFPYPFIIKPVDDGCSSAVKLIRRREQLTAFLNIMFREEFVIEEKDAAVLRLKAKEEFPQKEVALIEELITANGAKYFLEITGGLMTHRKENGSIAYEVFEPSEVLASGEVLSLEEKFLAGEGQNITPARFTPNRDHYKQIAQEVKNTLEKAAKILVVEGYARIDAFVRIYDNSRVETIIIEVNSLPGMTPATCIFHQAAINGYKPYQFIDGILTYSSTNH